MQNSLPLNSKLSPQQSRPSHSSSRTSLRKLPTPPQYTTNTSNTTSLQQLINQSLKHLIEIIQILLMEENSNNYVEFIKRNEEMCEEMERKIERKFQGRFQEFRKEMAKMRNQPYQQQQRRGQMKRVSSNQLLKQQRITLTQSILSQNRSTHSTTLKTTHNISKSPKHQLSSSQHNDKTMSIDYHCLNQRSLQLQEKNKQLKKMVIEMERRMEMNQRDLRGLQEKFIEFRVGFQEKMDTSLEALWHVVTDISNKLMSDKQ